jgi:hypothetical protein
LRLRKTGASDEACSISGSSVAQVSALTSTARVLPPLPNSVICPAGLPERRSVRACRSLHAHLVQRHRGVLQKLGGVAQVGALRVGAALGAQPQLNQVPIRRGLGEPEHGRHGRLPG